MFREAGESPGAVAVDPSGTGQTTTHRSHHHRWSVRAPLTKLPFAEPESPRSVPKLRGVMHQYAVVAALSLGVVLVVLAAPGRARAGALVYGVGVTACLGMSALYHRGRWTPRMKALLCKCDHSTIFLLIAGTATPIILCTMRGPLGWSLLFAEWGGAAGGIGIALFWRQPPVFIEVGPYLVLGWLGLLAVPALVSTVGVTALVLLVSGGALFTIGSLCYAAERPDPWPGVFGFHEVFHGFVTSAAAAHAVMISIIVLRA